MNDQVSLSGLNIQMINDCLVVQINGDLNDDYIIQLRKKILEKVKETSARSVLIDVSAVTVLDTFTFSTLVDTARMVYIMGAKVVFVGFQAGVASALVDLDVEFGDIHTAVTIEDGFEMLQSSKTDFIPLDEPKESSRTSSFPETKENEQANQ